MLADNAVVMQLNNLLQAQGRLNTLHWKESAAGEDIPQYAYNTLHSPRYTGPAHGPEWTIAAVSIALITSPSYY